MKNVMIYNVVSDKRRHSYDELFALFKMQIDNSIYYGWDISDIIIGTNFEFEYRGVKTYMLHDICRFNIFNNKWYGLLELMSQGVLDDDIWFHDQDNWQVNTLNFPRFDGEVGAATYIRTPEWNTSALYIKRTGLSVIEYIVESMKMNPADYQSDENWLAFLRHNTEVSSYLASLDTMYCTGYTYIDDRINAASGPIQCLGFMPGTKSEVAFNDRGLIPEHLNKIFDLHKTVLNH